MTLDDIRKLAIEERSIANRATPGPWHRDQAQDGELLPDGTGYAGDYYETNDVMAPPVVVDGEVCDDDVASCIGSNNAAFVARSRTAVPALCNAVDALLAVVDALPKCVNHCGETATALTEAGTFRCDAHKHAYTWYSLPYVDALRAVARKS